MVGIMKIDSVNCKPVSFNRRTHKYSNPPSHETFEKVENGIKNTCGVPLNEFIRVLEERKFQMEHPRRDPDEIPEIYGIHDVMV